MEAWYWKSKLPSVMASPFPFVASLMKSSSRQPTTMMLVLLYSELGKQYQDAESEFGNHFMVI